MDRQRVSRQLRTLRKTFRYFCQFTPDARFVECAKEWPYVVNELVFTEEGDRALVDSRRLGTDPRLNMPVIKRKFRTPQKKTHLRVVADFALKKRDKRTRICDFTPLYKKYKSSKYVLNRITILNIDCGFRITKLNKKADGLYIVERERNRKL